MSEDFFIKYHCKLCGTQICHGAGNKYSDGCEAYIDYNKAIQKAKIEGAIEHMGKINLNSETQTELVRALLDLKKQLKQMESD